jgi:predicted lipoprotein with Yx(FWY)xxD motif
MQGGSSGRRLAGRLVGAGLLAATAGIHLDLYLTGYRTIPTIGPLFLLQVICGLALALAVVVLDRRIVPASGALFALATLGGYLLSMWVGLFGFKEVRTTAGIGAGVVEIVAFAVLGVVALEGLDISRVRQRPAATEVGGRRSAVSGRATGALVGSVSAVAAALLAAAVSAATAGATASPRGTVRLDTTKIGGVTVLTNARGLTLYWFALDSRTASRCYGECASYWPPVLGRPVASSAVKGRLGTIRRRGGALQATYDGHPLYTYVADSGRGQNHGNLVTLNGGEWFEMTASGAHPR